jgi:hypothetical protein
LAEASGVSISTPIRPASLTGLGYHPEGESLAAMEPRGKNLSANVVLGLLSRGETPERIHYYVMDAAGRGGPQTGAVDVGAATGTTVYAPLLLHCRRRQPRHRHCLQVRLASGCKPLAHFSISARSSLRLSLVSWSAFCFLLNC